MSDRNMDFWDDIGELKAELSRVDDLVTELRHEVESKDAEIARLREERLTVDEREAIEMSLALEWPHTSEQWQALARCLGPVCIVPANKYKVAIRSFLERHPLPPERETKETGNG